LEHQAELSTQRLEYQAELREQLLAASQALAIQKITPRKLLTRELPPSSRTWLTEEHSRYDPEGVNGDHVMIQLEGGYGYSPNGGFVKFANSQINPLTMTLPSHTHVSDSVWRVYPYRHVETVFGDWRSLHKQLTLGDFSGLDSRGETAYAMLGLDSAVATIDVGFFATYASDSWHGFVSMTNGVRHLWLDFTIVDVPVNTPAELSLELVTRGSNTWFKQTFRYPQPTGFLADYIPGTYTIVYPVPILHGKRVRFFRSSSLISHAYEPATYTGTTWTNGLLTLAEASGGTRELPFDTTTAVARQDVNEQPWLTCSAQSGNSELVDVVGSAEVRIECLESGNAFHGTTNFYVTSTEGY
ncbi:MAG: hypothetical protein AAF267_23675, partial [Deinococcota bacterium]